MSHSTHSAKHRSSHRSKNRSGATTKTQKAWRRVLAFVLFLTLTALSLFICVRTTFISKSSLIGIFTDADYVTAAQGELLDYAHDLCDACGVPYDSVDNAISVDKISEIKEAYIAGLLGASQEYTQTTYQDLIVALGDDIETQTKAMMKNRNIHTDDTVSNPAGAFADKIEEHLTEATELPHAEQLSTALNLAKTGSLAAVIFLAVLALILALIVVSIGTTRYRAVRYLAYASLSAALLDFLLVGGVQIVKQVKTLVLYPLYLSDALMRYVNRCLMSVSLSGGVLLLLAAVIMCIVWKMDRDSNN